METKKNHADTQQMELLRKAIDNLQEEKYRYKARVNILLEENDDAVRSIKVLKRQIEGLIEKEQSALHTLELCKDEIDLLNHILSINKIQLTPDVVQDAENHLRELTKEMIE